jgi:hypothetical protein
MKFTTALFAATTAVTAAACADTNPETSVDESDVWRDGDDWSADAGAHPQVFRLINPMTGTRCTGFLSSSNRVTTNAHCLANAGDVTSWVYDTTMANGTPAQVAALIALGTSTGGTVPALGTNCLGGGTSDACCVGADIAVLFFGGGTPMPRGTMRPLRLIDWALSEPECDGDDTCMTMIGTGRIGENTCQSSGPGPVDSGATQLHVESGVGTGYCEANEDMMYGEYDYDDSSPCNGDSGSPVIWKDTNELIAVARGSGGEIGDDVVGPVLWTNGDDTARDFYWAAAADQDNDGFQAFDDNCDRNNNINQADFNSDGIGDVCQDTDGDSLGDSLELTLGSNPADVDTDGDGLKDNEELALGTSLTDSDTDDDGLKDGEEPPLGTDPKEADTDGDLLLDGEEVNTYGTDPLDADTDDDGMVDGAEVLTYHTDPLDADSDDDHLDDGDEIDGYGTDPNDPDTDDDGVSDGDEILIYHTDPLDPDTDDDFLTDGFEIAHGTDPLDHDTDGDRIRDGRDVEWIDAAINALPNAAFLTPAHRGMFLTELADIEALSAQNKLVEARSETKTLRRRADGCGASFDADDWVVTCSAQVEIRVLIDELLGNF